MDREIVGHQVCAAQVVVPEVQLVFNRLALGLRHLCTLHSRVKQRDCVIDYGGQQFLRHAPVNGQALAQGMRVGEFAQGWHRDVTQEVCRVEYFHCWFASCVFAHKANQNPKNLKFAAGPDGGEIRVGGKQVISVFVSSKCFQCEFIINDRDHHFSGVGLAAPLDHSQISAVDPGIDH